MHVLASTCLWGDLKASRAMRPPVQLNTKLPAVDRQWRADKDKQWECFSLGHEKLSVACVKQWNQKNSQLMSAD